MSNFRSWYIRNQDKLTWFVIGWCGYGAVQSLTEGKYVSAAVLALLAYGNYKLDKIKL